MPRPTFPADRFDELPAADSGRVGAHRSENPRIRAGVVVSWAALATVVLVAVGIFLTLLSTGRISLSPQPVVTQTAAPTVEPVVDPSFEVDILNATSVDGLAGKVRDKLVAAGWSADNVTAGNAGSQNFDKTTVYYSRKEDAAVAQGLAEKVLGGARIQLSDAYADPSATGTDGTASKHLTVVIGKDEVAALEGSTPTP